MSFGQNVYIPDANFKTYLVNNSAINTNGDSEIQVSEANTYTGGIICFVQGIFDLTGIEAFTALTFLDCSENQLTSLDVSTNTALEVLYCYDNQLTSLGVSTNTALTDLSCSGNNLTSLDVSTNTALTELYCSLNQLTSLDVTTNTALELLDCPFNELTSLDVSSNNALEGLYCNTNELTSLDVSSNTALISLYCYTNELTSLDLSNNSALEVLYCDDNELECLNVKNGNNTAFVNFDALDNPNLSCIEVDDVNYSTTNWTNIDSWANFSTDCGNSGCSLSISELNNTPKQLIKIVDVLGREIPFKPNTPLLYIYNDGTVERKMIIKE